MICAEIRKKDLCPEGSGVVESHLKSSGGAFSWNPLMVFLFLGWATSTCSCGAYILVGKERNDN